MSASTLFFPGKRLRIIIGDGRGVPCEVITPVDAFLLWHEEGCPAEQMAFRAGHICVAITVFGKRLPLVLEASQLEPDPAGG
jgi:hypothetical protein